MRCRLLPPLSEWVSGERVTNGKRKIIFSMNLFPLNYYQLSSGSIMSERFFSVEAISLPSPLTELLFWVCYYSHCSHAIFFCHFLFLVRHFTLARALFSQSPNTNCRLSLTWKGYKWINKKELLFGFEMPENSKCTNFSWNISRHTNKLRFVSFRSLLPAFVCHSTSRVHLLNGKQKYANFLLLLLLYLWCGGAFFGCRCCCNSFIHSSSTTKNSKTKKFAFHCLCGIPSMS